VRVGDVASGRAGDKGSTLDLTIVARDAAAYNVLMRQLTPGAVQACLLAPLVERYELPGLLALKFVVPGVLGGGTYSSLRAGMHWQKAAVSALLDVELSERPAGMPRLCVRPPGWIGREAASAFDEMRAWALRAEELGFDGLFVGDRLLAQAPAAGQPVYAASMLEATTVLAGLAAVTGRIELGPLVMALPYRHPIQLAKTIATLDVIAAGRLILGAGIGWNATEFTALEIERGTRAQRFEEAIAIIRRLWTGETVSHSGSWSFDDVALSPLPARAGGPPIWLASFSPGSALEWRDDVPAQLRPVLDRVGRLADGWVPLIYSASARRRLDPAVLGHAWLHVLDSATQADRARQDIEFIFSDWCYILDGPASEARCRAALQGFFTGTWAEAQRTYSIGTAEQVAEKVRDHTRQIDRVDGYVLTPLGGDPEQLDALADVRQALRS
jgi:alkanesulfonate monooxygenase SsuD/methylene tetrahydromethanopterin reductase-like flavin-dependent oxidoreductase (luciferase family)